ncbi:kinase-like domain-containing protein [Nemania sp. NC0429]|nr:kinase-like domain-containing protein [Nemania sp. NC0429]
MTISQEPGVVKSEHSADAPTHHGTAKRAVSHRTQTENVTEHGPMITLDHVDDDTSSYNNSNDGHLRGFSRRNSQSSVSTCSCSVLSPITQLEVFPKIPDPDELKSPTEISEPEFKNVEPRSHLCDTETRSHDSVTPAAIRGQELSLHDIKKVDPRPLLAPGLRAESLTLITPASSTVESLQDCLLAEIHPDPKGSKGFFLPSKRLENLIRSWDLEEELTRRLQCTTDPRTIQDLAEKICAEGKSCQKIFTILALIEKADTIVEFLDEGVHDGDLPLIKLDKAGRPGLFELGRKSKTGTAQPLECFRSFSRINVINFEDYQWAVLAPVFDRPHKKDVSHYDLEDPVILPFTEEEEVSEGGFGRISRVKIHPDHHNFKDSVDNQFAIKRLHSHDEHVFRGEFEMLSKFSDDSHPHLISLLAAYNHRKSFYFIFHWAKADLVNFWMEIKPRPKIQETVQWVADQCFGLADGLKQIHIYESFRENRSEVPADGSPVRTKLYGRHGDIKPENILWFPSSTDGGTLKLTDFGLAEFHTLYSRSNLRKSRIATSASYRPPECDMIDGRISRSYDIWTMGCLYLEFIAWLLGGWELVRDFTIARATQVATPSLDQLDYSFFESVESGKTARVKEQVKEVSAGPACCSGSQFDRD